ncbi:AAA family ATPase [Actinosynnema sp. CS-041913]|uniref:AAA family ATPase n=1 Tax=Actinosynnema sp. CS-041913 TaxID=3239917 RepID=UPI003D8C5EAB
MTIAVEKPITIGVTGTHSTGKSTFLARLAHDLRKNNIQVATVADLGEQAQRLGLPILHNHTWASTMWFITHGISLELAVWPHAEVVLVDRPVPDALAYYRAALAHRDEHADPDTHARLEAVVRSHVHVYDLLYRTTLDPDIPLGTDKPRDPDTAFRRLADHHVRQVLHDLDISHTPLHADEHDQALTHAVRYILARLTEPPVNTPAPQRIPTDASDPARGGGP